MDNLLLIFFSSAFVFATLGISAITFVIKQIVEYFLSKPWFPGDKASDVWRKLLLPILPILVGAACGYLFTGFPYPDGFNLTTSARTVYAMVAGLLSTTCFRIFKDFLLSKMISKGVPEQVVTKIEAIKAIEDIAPVEQHQADSVQKDHEPPQLS